MPNQVIANVLYNVTSATPLMGLDVTATINCAELASFSPRKVWITTQIAPGDGTALIYVITSDEPTDLTNAIQGYMVVQGSQTIVIDAIDGGLEDACDACCDGDNSVTPYYTSGVPAFTVPTTTAYCIERTDAGDASAFENFNLAYLTQILNGGTVSSRTTGVTSYDVVSYTVPIAIGSDTVSEGACS